MASLRIDMIGLTTADMARSIAFYRLLGVEVPEHDPERPYHEATLPNGIRLSWNDVELIKKVDPHWQPAVGQRMTLAFHCETPAGVDATYAAVQKAGFEGIKAPWDAFWGQRYAMVRDPDGNSVDLFAPSAAD